jgi:hypothetical protein
LRGDVFVEFRSFLVYNLYVDDKTMAFGISEQENLLGSTKLPYSLIYSKIVKNLLREGKNKMRVLKYAFASKTGQIRTKKGFFFSSDPPPSFKADYGIDHICR